MFIQNTIELVTGNLNTILRLIDFDELRNNGIIKVIEKDMHKLHHENTRILYDLIVNNDDVVNFNASVVMEESINVMGIPVMLQIKLTEEDIIEAITEYFSLKSIPFKAIKIINCTGYDKNLEVLKEANKTLGIKYFGTLTITVEKIPQRVKKFSKN